MLKIKVAKWHGFFYTLHNIWKTQEYILDYMYREKYIVWYLISLNISDNFLKTTDDYIYLYLI